MKSIWHEPGYQHPYPLHNKTIIGIDGRVIYWSMYGWSVPYNGDTTGIGVPWALLDDILALAKRYENVLCWLKGIHATTKEFWEERNDIISTDLAIIMRALGTAIEDSNFTPTEIAAKYDPPKEKTIDTKDAIDVTVLKTGKRYLVEPRCDQCQANVEVKEVESFSGLVHIAYCPRCGSYLRVIKEVTGGKND